MDAKQKAALAAALRAHQKQLAERQAASRAAWARQHPEAAAAERSLRKGRAELLERWRHKNEGTPETHEQASRRNQGALARLYQSGAIDAEQLAAAVEIALVAERIVAGVAVRTSSVETRVDVTRMGDGSFYERLGQVRREAAYSEWRRRLPCPAPVLDMLGCFDSEPTLSNHGPLGFTIVARRYRMHHRKAKQLLVDALDLWPCMLGIACKEIDEDTLTRAHARLAA